MAAHAFYLWERRKLGRAGEGKRQPAAGAALQACEWRHAASVNRVSHFPLPSGCGHIHPAHLPPHAAVCTHVRRRPAVPAGEARPPACSALELWAAPALDGSLGTHHMHARPPAPLAAAQLRAVLILSSILLPLPNSFPGFSVSPYHHSPCLTVQVRSILQTRGRQRASAVPGVTHCHLPCICERCNAAGAGGPAQPTASSLLPVPAWAGRRAAAIRRQPSSPPACLQLSGLAPSHPYLHAPCLPPSTPLSPALSHSAGGRHQAPGRRLPHIHRQRLPGRQGQGHGALSTRPATAHILPAAGTPAWRVRVPDACSRHVIAGGPGGEMLTN